MSDARWVEIEEDIDAAAKHFQNAVDLHAEGGFDAPGLAGYRANMAFMHAMQAGHTSMESGLERILKMLGEEMPVGESWHRDLIKRVSRSLADRPAIFPHEVARAADETRKFRNLATRSYDNFSVEFAEPSVNAAGVLSQKLQEVLKEFKAKIDPPEDDGDGDGSGGGMSGGPQ